MRYTRETVNQIIKKFIERYAYGDTVEEIKKHLQEGLEMLVRNQ